ncbi:MULTISPECIES: hypothetical protein [unclassified Ruegeria]|uniref:hypothetical protein n=1 Tax=unclassified Ruegeria TaxID=2625375 RepID=UPI001ADAC259|nr:MULTISPECIES: hypothetical protein [unclassified Ruegeria]MBO9410756.1 hypothetical protein [Ruegeria sp. R8_1]MBO9414957.1 hypothetical protein [Ruegeria sp. R8_2]
MEHSEQSKKIIELGKRIVQELDLDQSCDTLGRWMAHHLAQLITKAEQGPEDGTSAAQQECRAAIFELWEHILSVPTATRPFRDLEPVVETIRALDPDERTYFYQTRAQEIADSSDLPEAAKDWLKLSRGIDHSARILIQMCFDRVGDETSGKLKEWIELASDAGASELPIVRVIHQLQDQQGGRERSAEEQRKKLRERLERLDSMVRLSELLAHDIQHQLNELDRR